MQLPNFRPYYYSSNSKHPALFTTAVLHTAQSQVAFRRTKSHSRIVQSPYFAASLGAVQHRNNPAGNNYRTPERRNQKRPPMALDSLPSPRPCAHESFFLPGSLVEDDLGLNRPSPQRQWDVPTDGKSTRQMTHKSFDASSVSVAYAPSSAAWSTALVTGAGEAYPPSYSQLPTMCSRTLDKSNI